MAVILDARLWVPGGDEPPGSLLDDLLAGRPRGDGPWWTAPDPARPPGVAGGAWRRMSRLSRAVLATAAPLVADRPDRERIPVIHGTVLGELAPITRFLERLFGEGPQAASPLAFQNSVNNAPAGHLGIAMGLRGFTETVGAGGATGLAALARGLDLVALGRAPAVLVVVGDDLPPIAREAWAAEEPGRPAGEAVAAVLLGAEGDGPRVTVTPGVPEAGEAALGRTVALPWEEALGRPPGLRPCEPTLGVLPSPGLVLVAALARARRPGVVLDRDGDLAWTARVG